MLQDRPLISSILNINAGVNRNFSQSILNKQQYLLEKITQNKCFISNSIDESNSLLQNPSILNCDILLLSGGDGTFQSLLSKLINSRQNNKLPVIGLLPSGSANISVIDLYQGARSLRQVLKTLQKLLHKPASEWPLLQRNLIRVHRPDNQDQYGFIFTMGVIVTAIRHCVDSVYSKNYKSQFAVTLATLRAIYGLMFSHSQYLEALDIRIMTEFKRRKTQNLIILASTLQRFFLKINPYWKHNTIPTKATFNYGEIGANAPNFTRALPRLLLGMPSAKMRASGDYLSEVIEKVTLDFNGLYVLDGEFVDHKGILELSTSAPLTFLDLSGCSASLPQENL